MRALILLVAVVSLGSQTAPTPVPVYTRESIRPSQGGDRKTLAPGMIVEIYGQHLAPEPWCGESRTPPDPYPAELCGVRVLVGSRTAGLMYAGPSQINIRIPADAPAEGSAPIQVCVRGVCGAPVTMPFAAHKAFLSLRGTAYVHMPVWIDIYQTTPEPVRYPCGPTPWSFDGYRLEVRRNGQTLPPIPQPAAASSGSAAGCRAAAVSWGLPLHLLYNLDQPGVYSVRFSSMRTEGPQSRRHRLPVGLDGHRRRGPARFRPRGIAATWRGARLGPAAGLSSGFHARAVAAIHGGEGERRSTAGLDRRCHPLPAGLAGRPGPGGSPAAYRHGRRPKTRPT